MKKSNEKSFHNMWPSGIKSLQTSHGGENRLTVYNPNLLTKVTHQM